MDNKRKRLCMKKKIDFRQSICPPPLLLPAAGEYAFLFFPLFFQQLIKDVVSSETRTLIPNKLHQPGKRSHRHDSSRIDPNQSRLCHRQAISHPWGTRRYKSITALPSTSDIAPMGHASIQLPQPVQWSRFTFGKSIIFVF